MKHPRLILVFILAKVVSVSYGQTLRPEIEKLANDIAKGNTLQIGYAEAKGGISDQWERYVKLKNLATNEELIILTNHIYPVVRCYSFKALATRENVDILPLLIRQLYDTAMIYASSGDIGTQEMTGDYFLEVVKSPFNLKSYKLNSKDSCIIDSILIFDKAIRLFAKSEILVKLKPEMRFYNRIKEIVETENSDNALVALSKYQKQEDKQFIINKLKSNYTLSQFYGLWAVRNFPDSTFFPYVQAIHAQEINKLTGFDYPLLKILYQAIVQYKNYPSRELIELTFKEAKYSALEYHSKYIWLALEKYQNKIYIGLQEKVVLNEDEKRQMNLWLEDPDY